MRENFRIKNVKIKKPLSARFLRAIPIRGFVFVRLNAFAFCVFRKSPFFIRLLNPFIKEEKDYQSLKRDSDKKNFP